MLAGYSAALLLDADCAPRLDVPAEVVVPGGGQRGVPGLLVRRDRIAPGETWPVADVRVPVPLCPAADDPGRRGGPADRIGPGETCPAGDVRCTSPLRTAYDLGRRGTLVDRVVAVDRLANRHRFNPDLLLNFAVHYRGGRGTELICETLAHANRYSGSPMETRLRLLIEAAGLPRPRVQWVVQDSAARTAVWLDLAWPEIMVGIEYEGDVHATAKARRIDTRRYTALVDKGWRIYRYTSDEVLGEPAKVIAELSRACARVR